MAKSNVDPITLSVVRGVLETTQREMTLALEQTARSSVFNLAHDYSTALFNHTPEMILQGQDIPIHLGSLIPAMKAGRIAELADITDGNWAPVNAADMSTKADENIYVLGDSSQQGDMPKSGFSANSQAKVCANAIRGALTGSRVFPARFSNTCWSLIDTDNGVKVGATYEATDEKIAKVDGFISATGESAELRKATYEESEGWYAGITADMFG